MKYNLFIISTFITFAMFGQKTDCDSIKPRLSFVPDKWTATDLSHYIIIDKDTLYASYKTDFDTSLLKSYLEDDEGFLNHYRMIVFLFTDKNSKVIYEVKQWAAPIIVYLDKNLPKTVRSQFEEFYSQIQDVKNLKIGFTSKLKDANYQIKVTTTPIKANKNDSEISNKKNNINSILNGGTYSLLTDDNNKFYSGILSININGRNDIDVIKQLKQLFFMSLGSFYGGFVSDNNSLLSKHYDNSSNFSDFDLKILKMHYHNIYEQKINGTTFLKLYNLSKQK